ncbi:hypothetical protein KSK37_13435, partial [Kaistella sp. DKR-2]|uniref:hypothetical protein n=1 Tax=Kaistella soli TaxID=2849654 RepID=UPI001C259084
IPTLHGKIFEGIFPMWKFAKLLPSKQTKSNLTFTIYCPNFGGNYKKKGEKTFKDLVLGGVFQIMITGHFSTFKLSMFSH